MFQDHIAKPLMKASGAAGSSAMVDADVDVAEDSSCSCFHTLSWKHLVSQPVPCQLTSEKLYHTIFVATRPGYKIKVVALCILPVAGGFKSPRAAGY